MNCVVHVSTGTRVNSKHAILPKVASFTSRKFLLSRKLVQNVVTPFLLLNIVVNKNLLHSKFKVV